MYHYTAPRHFAGVRAGESEFEVEAVPQMHRYMDCAAIHGRYRNMRGRMADKGDM